MKNSGEFKTTRRSLFAGLGALVAGAALASCSSTDDALAEQAGNAGGKNYIAGDGSVMELSPEERGEPVDFTSTLFNGEKVSMSQLRGEPVLLNFWYAACAPCRVEAPDLKALHNEFQADVAFYGVNVRDNEGTAEAFERNFGIEYPSFEDRNGNILLAMTDYVPPQAVPTTLVLDKEGRVSARILGIAEHSTLRALINTAREE